MNGTLIVAEHLRGELRDVTRQLLTAAQLLRGPVTVALIAPDPSKLDRPAERPALLMVPPPAFTPAPGGGNAPVPEFVVELKPSRARHHDFAEAAAGDVDITTADFLLSIGRGIGAKEAIPQFEQLA